jgi:hypothetical protein
MAASPQSFARDGERQPAQRHEVEADPEIKHRYERDQHRDGQRQNDDQGRTDVKQKYDRRVRQ